MYVCMCVCGVCMYICMQGYVCMCICFGCIVGRYWLRDTISRLHYLHVPSGVTTFRLRHIMFNQFRSLRVTWLFLSVNHLMASRSNHGGLENV